MTFLKILKVFFGTPWKNTYNINIPFYIIIPLILLPWEVSQNITTLLDFYIFIFFVEIKFNKIQTQSWTNMLSLFPSKHTCFPFQSLDLEGLIGLDNYF